MSANKYALRTLLLIGAQAYYMQGAPISVPITGTAALLGGNTAVFNFSGANLFASSATIDWVNTVLSCPLSTFCNIRTTVPATFPFQGLFPPGASGGAFNGVTAAILEGELTFSGSALIPPGVLTMPVTLSGIIEGHSVIPPTFQPPVSLGPLLWSLDISGTGIVTFTGGGVTAENLRVFTAASYTFSGDATPVPEPKSILLFATAISTLAGGVWIRRA